MRLKNEGMDEVYDPLSGQTNYATTWSSAGAGTHGGDSNYVLSTLSTTIDDFLVQYFRVNEEACEKR